MSAIIDENKTQIDPGDEVRRLQDLVQKLEHQNQMLRTKQNQTSSTTTQRETNDNVISLKAQKDHDDNVIAPARTHIADEDNLKVVNSTMDDLDIIDLSNISEDEESWLYTSPKRCISKQRISPYKWLRQEFEHPSPEIETARRSLVYKLDEVTRVSHGPSLASNAASVPNHLGNGQSSAVNGIPSIRKSLFTGSRVDTSTFTRPKKIPPPSSRLHAPVGGSSPDTSPRTTPDRNGNASSTVNQVATSSSQESLEGGEPPPPHHQQQAKWSDVLDVARMQEESLRQSITTSPRKSLKGSRLALADPDSSHSSNRSSPGRYDNELSQSRRSSNSMASLSSHSNSPPDSPYGSQYLDHKPQASKSLVPSSSSRIMSPTTSRRGIPRPGIPRPSNSRLPAPRSVRSSIPSPSRRALQTRPIDDSWKDGCF